MSEDVKNVVQGMLALEDDIFHFALGRSIAHEVGTSELMMVLMKLTRRMMQFNVRHGYLTPEHVKTVAAMIDDAFTSGEIK